MDIFEKQGEPFFQHQPHSGSKNYLIHFNSAEGYLRQAEVVAQRDGLSSRREDRDEWSASRTFEEAVELARFGWRGGRRDLMSKIEELNLTYRFKHLPRFGLDVAGMYPQIEAAVAGDPECMVTQGVIRSMAKPVVQIVVNVGASAVVSKEAMINRGVATMAYVDYVEQLGYGIELAVVSTGVTSNYRISAGCIVKRAGEILDLDKAFFWVAHPSVHRRMFFSIIEQIPDDRFWNEFCYGYGSPYALAKVADFGEKENLIVLDGFMYSEEDSFRTIESAMKAIKKKFEEVLGNLEGDE